MNKLLYLEIFKGEVHMLKKDNLFVTKSGDVLAHGFHLCSNEWVEKSRTKSKFHVETSEIFLTVLTVQIADSLSEVVGHWKSKWAAVIAFIILTNLAEVEPDFD